MKSKYKLWAGDAEMRKTAPTLFSISGSRGDVLYIIEYLWYNELCVSTTAPVGLEITKPGVRSEHILYNLVYRGVYSVKYIPLYPDSESVLHSPVGNMDASTWDRWPVIQNPTYGILGLTNYNEPSV